MKTIKHLFGFCQDHASHLDLGDIAIIASAVIAVALVKTLNRKSRA